MKRFISFALSLLVAISACAAIVTAQENGDGTITSAVEFYKEHKGDNFLYEMRPPSGNEIPYGVSKYPTAKCYYPLGKNSGLERPEIYTWDTATMEIEGNFVKFSPTKNSMSLTFDTTPASYYMDYSKPYFTMVLKTSNAFSGSLFVKTLDSKYRKEFPIEFTGEWQKVILDFSDENGWTVRDENKEYQPYYKTPFSKEINDLFGGHNFVLNGNDKTDYYLFDYIMMFDSIENAEAFNGIANVVDTSQSKVEETRTIMSAKSRPSLYFMNGYSDGTFKPNQGMTRAEAAAVLARLMESEAVISEFRETSFNDISKDDWYYNYVTFLEKYGVLKIFEEKFLPNQKITRAEFVALAANAGVFDPAKAQDVEISFSDVAVGDQYYEAIKAAALSGAVNGYADGTFAPQGTLTRAEITTVLCRILDIKEKADKKQKFSDLDKSHWAYGGIMAVTSTADYEAGKEKVLEVDKITAEKIEEIRNSETTVKPKDGGTAYYVSANGNDANDGKSPETAWKTLDKVSNAKYNDGDVVYFKRGDIFRLDDSALKLTNGVSYSAYGEGEKPRIYGSPQNGADASMWKLYDEKNNIWRYEEPVIDQGPLIFNGGEKFATVLQTYYSESKGKFTNADGSDFDISKALRDNLSMFCETIAESGYPIASKTKGYLYIKCDDGNPGEIFDSIEFMPSRHMITAQSSDYNFKNTVVENLCVMYGGAHGIHASTATNFTVKNCEFGWIGGGIQSYTHSGTGAGARYGNAVETGLCDGYYVTDNYIYQCYDAGITFQTSNEDGVNHNVKFDNNVIENCNYSIEYWLSPATKDPSLYNIADFTINNNIMRNAGEGICTTRPNKGYAAHIKGWTKYNAVKDNSYEISGNIFDKSADMMVHIGLTSQTAATSKPKMYGNTWIQYISDESNNATFGEYELSFDRIYYNEDIFDVFEKYGIKDTDVYFLNKY